MRHPLSSSRAGRAPGRPKPALAHAAIRASWTDLAYNRVSGVSQTPMGGVVLSDSNGSYAICGVPNGALLRLSGATDSATSGTIEVLPRTAGVTHIDFAVATIADSAVRGTVSGVVRDEAGKPVSQARIELNGAPDARTDDEGRFTMSGVPLGTRQLQVVSIGWDPTAAIVHVSPREPATLTLVLRKVTALKEVRVSVRTVKQRWVEDLEDRRKLGIARFVDSTIVERRPNVTEAIMDSPSARLQRGGQISFPGSCNPTVRDRKSTRLNSSHGGISRMPSSA